MAKHCIALVAAITLLCAASFTDAVPVRPTFQGFRHLKEIEDVGTFDGVRGTRDVRWQHPSDESLHLRLRYDIKLADRPIIALQDEMSVVAVEKCDEKSAMTLVMESEAAATAMEVRLDHPDLMLAGGSEWGCKNGTGSSENIAIRRHIKSVSSVSDPDAEGLVRITLTTTRAVLHEFFEHADVEYYTTAFRQETTPRANPTARSWQAVSDEAAVPPQSQLRGRKLKCCHRIRAAVQKLKAKVISIGNKIKSVAQGIKAVVVAVATGAADINKKVNIVSFKLGSPNGNILSSIASSHGQHGIGPGVDAQIWVDTSLYVQFVFKMASYKVSELQVTGGLTFNAGAQITLGPSTPVSLNIGYDFEPTYPLTEECVLLGIIPLCIKPEIVLSVAVTGDVGTAGTLKMGAQKTGSYTAGLAYAPSTGVKFIGSHNTQSQVTTPTYDNGLSVALSFDFVPALVLSVDDIGGPALSLSPGIDITVQHYTSSPPCGSSGKAVTVDITEHLILSVAVMLEVTIAKHVILSYALASKDLASISTSVGSTCIPLARRRRLLELGAPEENSDAIASREGRALSQSHPLYTNLDPGMVFNGVVNANTQGACSNMPMRVNVEAQLVAEQDWWISVSSFKEIPFPTTTNRRVFYHQACAAQNAYIATPTGVPGELSFAPVANPANRVSCSETLPQEFSLPPHNIATLSEDNSTLTFTPPAASCFPTFQLKHVQHMRNLVPTTAIATVPANANTGTNSAGAATSGSAVGIVVGVLGALAAVFGIAAIVYTVKQRSASSLASQQAHAEFEDEGVASDAEMVQQVEMAAVPATTDE